MYQLLVGHLANACRSRYVCRREAMAVVYRVGAGPSAANDPRSSST